MNNHLISIILISLLSVALSTDVEAANKFFRYTDANGKTVVSSYLPPEFSQKGYEVVNEMGLVLETIAPRKTRQQVIEEQSNKTKLVADAKILRDQQQLDLILINSYTDISDIERARDNELVSKDRDILLLEQNIRRLTRLLEDTQTRAARDERLGKKVSQSILDEVEGFKKRIAKEEIEIANIEQEKVAVSERYDSSITRFSELKAAEQILKHRPEELDKENSQVTIYKCSSGCDSAWQTALRYASENSTTELAWANDLTIMMRKPRKEDDISITMTRVNSNSGAESSFVLEVNCNKSLNGDALCDSEKVKSIEAGFIPYLN